MERADGARGTHRIFAFAPLGTAPPVETTLALQEVSACAGVGCAPRPTATAAKRAVSSVEPMRNARTFPSLLRLLYETIVTRTSLLLVLEREQVVDSLATADEASFRVGDENGCRPR